MHTMLPENKNPVLRDISKDILLRDIKSPRIKKLITDMKALLAKEEYGVALAAPQVGEPIRLFIVSGRALLRQAQDKSPRHPRSDYEHNDSSIDVSRHSTGPEGPGSGPRTGAESRDQVYINPVILKTSRAKKGKHEGCLSIRGKWGIVVRAEKASIRAHDETGKLFTRGASGFLAHVFQHEMDHLNGILYTDKATKIYDESEEKRS
ncbi:hypothetical protein COU18_01460 [Candidatus Kaiserbacteria bacterium CG10_big_fil_rev_8_21_14_0_10_51_14]|uniref:Peptide deformylase n=1 Tax=Candidatus Kaiserbacteria bacterium CG10_big_fil_rev_8_21_14_0_10_51_14 TaxID=1974610 RepID=A0A2H0UE43_9BACT|nr:MAG: hypothetical protein COU18_01460 [Candidatus Kaiserbacteria bacterium CG10_big_fil_rev_8_21_14_0_10_51_14]